MADKMRLIDANGSFTINANDNTNHSLCFGGGIISVMDGYGRCICEFDAEDAPEVNSDKGLLARDDAMSCKMLSNKDISVVNRALGYLDAIIRSMGSNAVATGLAAAIDQIDHVINREAQ